MSTAESTVTEIPESPTLVGTRETHEHKVRNNRMGMWLFFISEGFMFGALLVARFFLWGNTRPDLDQNLALIITTLLLISSYFMNRAETAIAYGDRQTFTRSLMITAVLGTLFLIGVVGFEWSGHLSPDDGVFGAVFFGMTGLHALHVLSGVILILIVWNRARQGEYSPESHWGVEATAIYWHYVDLIWVFYYPALYLIGNAAG
jgi:cytochrome c oxidase subunit 3